MASPLIRAADALDDMSAIFEAKRGADTVITASQSGACADLLKAIVRQIRTGERQRMAALNLAGNPVGDGLTVVLRPFEVVRGGRA